MQTCAFFFKLQNFYDGLRYNFPKLLTLNVRVFEKSVPKPTNLAEVKQNEILLDSAENRPVSETVIYTSRGNDKCRYNLPTIRKLLLYFLEARTRG